MGPGREPRTHTRSIADVDKFYNCVISSRAFVQISDDNVLKNHVPDAVGTADGIDFACSVLLDSIGPVVGSSVDERFGCH